MRYCSNCGKPVGESENFCTYCGHSLSKKTTEEKNTVTESKKNTISASKSETSKGDAPKKDLKLLQWLKSGLKNERQIIPVSGFVGLICILIFGFSIEAEKAILFLINRSERIELDNFSFITGYAGPRTIVITIAWYWIVLVTYLFYRLAYHSNLNFRQFNNYIWYKNIRPLALLLGTVVLSYLIAQIFIPANMAWNQNASLGWAETILEIMLLISVAWCLLNIFSEVIENKNSKIARWKAIIISIIATLVNGIVLPMALLNLYSRFMGA